MTSDAANRPSQHAERTRLDKWLWAARFYKTRGLAKAAINGGKVHVNEMRVKAAKAVAIGDILRITHGEVARTVVVTGFAERRGSASVAATLYAETAASVTRREADRMDRRLRNAGLSEPNRRPDKQERRKLLALRNVSE